MTVSAAAVSMSAASVPSTAKALSALRTPCVIMHGHRLPPL